MSATQINFCEKKNNRKNDKRVSLLFRATTATLLASVVLFSSSTSSSLSTSHENQNSISSTAAAFFPSVLAASGDDNDDNDIMGDDDVMGDVDFYADDDNGDTKKSGGGGGLGDIVAAMNGMQDFFAGEGGGGCEKELIPPEESCCYAAPGNNNNANKNKMQSSSSSSPLSPAKGAGFSIFGGGGADAAHECFAPPIHDEEHPWDSSPALQEALQSAHHELDISEFEKLIFGGSGSSGSSISGGAENNKVLVIDTRCAAEFVAGHVPSAVFGGLGTDQFDRFIGTVHSDHNVPVVFIHTPTITTSGSNTLETDKKKEKVIEEIAQRLVKAGLSNLKGHLKGGMATWLAARKPITTMRRWTAAQLVEKLAGGRGESSRNHHRQSLIDLREPCASDFSTLPNAESIPVSETVLQEVFHRAQHETDPNHPLVLFCSNGFRSLMVASALKAMKADINIVCMEEGFDTLSERENIKALMAAAAAKKTQ